MKIKMYLLDIIFTFALAFLISSQGAFASSTSIVKIGSNNIAVLKNAESQEYILDEDIIVDKTIEINIENYTKFSLNGHYIKMTGEGSAIEVKGDGSLVIVGGGSDKHKFIINSGVCELNDSATGEEGVDYQVVTGSFITGGTDSGIKITDGANVTIEDVKIIGCSAKNGGGVYVENGQFELRGSDILYCKAEENGGGIYVNKDGELYFTQARKATIKNCTAESGSAISFCGKILSIIDAIIYGDIVDDRTEKNGYCGISSGTFYGNVDFKSYILGGTFNGEVKSYGIIYQIYSPVFNGKVSNYGKIASYVAGKEIEDYLSNNINVPDGATATFNKEVTNYGAISAGTFNDNIITPIKDVDKTSVNYGEGKELTFSSYADISNFERVEIDNKTIIENTDYTKESGSTVVKLKPSYVASLQLGTHTIKIVSKYVDKESAATATFTISDTASSSSEEDNSSSSATEPVTETVTEPTLDDVPKTGGEDCSNAMLFFILSATCAITAVMLKRFHRS